MATLAQIYRRMGYAQKALEFGSFAAKSFDGMDFLAQGHRVSLPLTMVIADTPQMLGTDKLAPVPVTTSRGQRTELEPELPPAIAPETKAAFRIVSPQPGNPVSGMQQVRTEYTGTREIKFVIFLADHVMCGMMTDLPFHFEWDADGAAPGEHQLCVRAYDASRRSHRRRYHHGHQRHRHTVCRDRDLERDAGNAVALTGDDHARHRSRCRYSPIWAGGIMTCMRPSSPSSRLKKPRRSTPPAMACCRSLAQLYKEHGMHALSENGEIYHGAATGSKHIALTFDDGPNPLYTPSILRELKKYDAHATFFLVGKMVQLYPDLVLQILADGHELANHSYTHPNLTKLTKDQIIAEVLRTRAVIKEITGRQTYLFRPPGGDIDSDVLDQLRALDYNVVYWDVNAGEFRKHPPQEEADMIVNKAKDGSIVLMHNGQYDGTMNILPILMAELSQRGFTFVTVSELMSEKQQFEKEQAAEKQAESSKQPTTKPAAESHESLGEE